MFSELIALFSLFTASFHLLSRDRVHMRRNETVLGAAVDAPNWRTEHDKLKIQAGGLDLGNTHEKNAAKSRRTTARENVHV